MEEEGVTFRLRAKPGSNVQTVLMDRENYIAPIVEAYIPNATHAEKLALSAELFSLFDALWRLTGSAARFDTLPLKMVESDSRTESNPASAL